MGIKEIAKKAYSGLGENEYFGLSTFFAQICEYTVLIISHNFQKLIKISNLFQIYVETYLGTLVMTYSDGFD